MKFKEGKLIMSNKKENFVKIVSDGECFNTHVYTMNGEEIRGIVEIKIDISVCNKPIVQLTLIPEELDIVALVDTIEQIQSVTLPVKIGT